MPSKIIYSTQVFTQGHLKEASILVEKGAIKEVLNGKVTMEGVEFVDYENLVVFPGVIDAHLHINEPGRTEWEGFDSATKAAAAGGITTLIDMPLNSSPVTIDVLSYKQKVEASNNKRHVHCGFWGGLVPSNAANLSEILQTGVLGLKAFLTPSGIDEFQHVSESDLKKGLAQLKEAVIPLLAHCELDADHQGLKLFEQHPFSYEHFVNSRPKSWENNAVRLMISLCKEYKTPIHIVHLSSADVLPDILKAKEEGLPLTVETCPHYLFFTAEKIPDKDTRFKCTPPIRDSINNEQLWEALDSGLIDFIASDHSPAPPSLKEADSGNLWEAWGGIIGGQCLLTASWTKAKSKGNQVEQLAKWLCEGPASFIGFGQRKGKIKSGFDADFVVWDPEKSYQLAEESLLHKHRFSPYVGNELYGEIVSTYCDGELIYHRGKMEQLSKGNLLEK